MMKFTLYIAGKTDKSQQAVKQIYKICEENFKNQYKIIVIDVLEEPRIAEEKKILATPTLIKELPLPIRRIIGDLSDKEKVLMGLGIVPTKAIIEEKQAELDE